MSKLFLNAVLCCAMLCCAVLYYTILYYGMLSCHVMLWNAIMSCDEM